MSDKSKVLCKYYVSGVCRFGSECAFSHNFSDMQHQVCKFYLAGCCTYGDRCRYEHKRPDYWKAAQAARGAQQQQQHQSLAAAAATTSRPPQATPQQQQQQQQQQRQQSNAAAAPNVTDQNGGGSGSGGAHRLDPHARAWDAPAPQDQQQQLQQLRLPRSLSGGGTGGRGPCRSSAAAAAAAAAGGTSGQQGEVDVAEEPREGDAAGGSAGSAHAAGAAEAAQYDEQADGYDEYDDEDAGMYDKGGSFMGYDQQHGQYYGGEDGEDDGGGGADGGLAIVDDDVGLELEAAVAAAVARGSRRAAAGPLGGGADLPPSSRWGAAQHPWEAEGEVASTAGTADPVDPAEVELCPGFSLHGRCAEGEECALIHGLECEICHKHRIHPYNAEAADEHRATCRLRHERLEARLRSAPVECGICLEAVMDKPSVSERRFGLLSCDHPFCLACIRSWRGRTDDASLATDTAVRTCPICRTPSHFVTPSLVWPATAEEKAGIVGAYKDRLGSMDCKHFDFGEGSCPFSTSCFYRHMYRDGKMEEPVLRRAGNADGGVRVVMPVRLSAFFDTPQAQQLMGRRR